MSGPELANRPVSPELVVSLQFPLRAVELHGDFDSSNRPGVRVCIDR